MKVKELIKILQELDQEKDIAVDDTDGHFDVKTVKTINVGEITYYAISIVGRNKNDITFRAINRDRPFSMCIFRL